jgi:hypothetical protein
VGPRAGRLTPPRFVVLALIEMLAAALAYLRFAPADAPVVVAAGAWLGSNATAAVPRLLTTVVDAAIGASLLLILLHARASDADRGWTVLMQKSRESVGGPTALPGSEGASRWPHCR